MDQDFIERMREILIDLRPRSSPISLPETLISAKSSKGWTQGFRRHRFDDIDRKMIEAGRHPGLEAAPAD
jgi:hypothetical protein